MIYDTYKAKIEYVAKILSVIKKYRVLIVSVLSAIVLSTAGAVTFSGTVYGESECPTQIVYGERLPYQAKALFNTASLEFSSENGSEWFLTEPSAVGTYRVRAVSTGSFGDKRCGAEHTYTVVPKEVTVTVSDEMVYGEKPTLSASTAYRDYVACENYSYGDVEDRKISVEPQKDSITVYNFNGEDVTHCYNLSTEKAKVSLLNRKITLSVADASHVYDGKDFSMHEWTITDGELADGDEINVDFTATVHNAGESVQNKPTISVADVNGNSVTEFYDVAGNYGYLTVVKRPVLIQPDDNGKTYDGKRLEAQWEIDGTTPLAESHNIKTIEFSSIVDAGSVEIQLKKAVILDENSIDVTANYDLSCAAGHYLTVEKRPLHLYSESETIVYDGERFTWEQYDLDSNSLGLPENEEIKVEFTAFIDGVGNTDNVFTAQVFKADGQLSNDNYDIEYTYGELYVNPRPIYVTTHTYEWIYDGKTHFDDEPYVEKDLTVTNLYYSFLWEKHELVFAVNEENRPSVRVVSDGKKANDVVLTVKDRATGDDVSSCYNIKKENGTLSVLPRPIKLVQTHDCSWIYDGKSHYDGDGEGNTKPYGNDDLVQNGDYYPLVDGDLLKIDQTESIPRITNVKDSGKDNKLSFAVTDKDGNAAAENYDIQQSTTYGKLTIKTRTIGITTHTHEWTYDGKEHGCDSNCSYGNTDLTIDIEKGYYPLVEGHSIYTTSAAKYRDAGEHDNNVEFCIKNGEDFVSDNYDIKCVNGKIIILKREITVASESASKVYDGTPLIKEVAKIKAGKLADGEQAAFIDFAARTNVGVEENGFSVNITSTADGKETTENYDITYEYGKLTITQRAIKVITHDHAKTYDGTPLSCQNCTTYNAAMEEEYYPLVEGHSLVVGSASSITFVKDSGQKNEVTFLVKNGSDDVTSNYSVTYVYGTLQITKRKISVCTHTHEWIYDGKDHSCSTEGCKYTQDDVYVGNVGGVECLELPAVDELSIKECTTIAFNCADSVDNDVSFTIVNDEGTDVTSNYNFISDKSLIGKLTIAKRIIKVTPASDKKTFDGNPHRIEPDKCIFIEDTALASGDSIEGFTAGTDYITNVGKVEHAFNEASSMKVWHNGANDTKIDVTEFYEIKTEGVGYMEITPYELEIVTDGAKKEYDGTPLTNENYTVKKGAPDGYELKINITGTQTEVGESLNTFDYKVMDPSGKDVTENFTVVKHEGSLIVVKGEDEAPDSGGSDPGGSGDDSDGGPISGDLTPDGFDEDGDGENSVVFQVWTDYSGRIYLRQVSFGNYMYSAWGNAASYTSDSISPLYYAGEKLEKNGISTANLKVMSQTILPYMLPYYTSQSAYVGSSDVKADYSWANEYTLVYYPYTYAENLSLNTFRVGTTDYSRYVYEYYTSLPEDTKSYMLEFASKNGISDKSTIFDIADFVSNYRPYNLKFKNEYTGDFARFFFEKADGAICQHYATAATAMLRAFGVPARYTGGFAVSAVANKLVDVSSMDAHAWVEVYVDDFGWIPLEVTGGGPGGSAPGDSGEGPSDGSQKLGTLTVKPIDIIVPSSEHTKIKHNNEVEFPSCEGLITSLINRGYRYEVTVQGEQIGIGKSESYVNSFKLFDASGKDVTDLYDIKYLPGTLEIVESIVVRITLERVQYTYDGTPKGYANNSWWTYTVQGAAEGEVIEVIFNIGNVTPIINPGKVTDDALLEQLKVISNGKDITDECRVVFSAQRLEVTKRELTFTSETASKVYDGEPLTSPTITITDGQGLVEGHIFKGEAAGIATEPYEEVKNIIGRITIYDAKGNDVTDYYEITKNEGTLTITL